jgi:tetratricopeptide (TPR) repeat protein
MEQKTFKIFLASSDDLRKERISFGNFIRKLNKIYLERGTSIDVFEWEDQKAFIDDRRTQDKYNDEVIKSDMFVALFYKKAGKYTIEEFDVAMAEFGKKGYPKVFVCCKALKKNEKVTPDLEAFKDKLNEKDKEKFWINFKNNDELQLRFVQQFLMVENDLMKLKLEGDKVTLDGLYIAELANLSFAAGNKDYSQFKKELEKLPNEIEKARKRTEKYPDDEDLRNELQEKQNHLNYLKEEFARLQQALFDTSQRIATMQRENLSDKLRRATEAFESGNMERANTLLDEIAHEAETHHANLEQDRELVHQDIEAFLLQAKTKMAEVNTPIEERIKEVHAIYVKADQWAKDSALPDDRLDGLLKDYAQFLYDYGKYKEAEPVLLRLVSLREKVLGKEHPSTATSYNNIGLTYDNMGDYAKALEYNFKALAIREKVLGKEHHDTATSYNNIGAVYKSQGDYPKALEYFFKALDIHEKVLGKEHPSTATSYNNIGTTYYNLGDYTKALEYHFKALDIREKVLGKEHPDTATSYNNIGTTYYNLGDYTKALEYLEKALDIIEKVLGPNHPNTITAKENMNICQLMKMKQESISENER